MSHRRQPDEPALLLITPFFYPNKGGVETHLNDLIAVLRNAGLRTYVIAYQPLNHNLRGSAWEDDGIVQIRRIPWLQGGVYNRLEGHRFFQLIFTTTGLLVYSICFMMRHRKEIRLFHAQGLYANTVGSILKVMFHKKLLTSLHMIYEFSPPGNLGPLMVGSLALADRVLVLSDRLLDELTSAGLLRVMKFRYWVDPEVFHPGDKSFCRSALGLPPRFTLAFVGRLVSDKGVLPLLEGALRLPDVTFLFAGDGPLADMVRKASVGHRNIVWLGEVDNRKLPIVYGAADVVWAAIDEDYIGRVAMEALSCARPLIALEEMTIDGATRHVRRDLFDSQLIHLVPRSPDHIRSVILRLSEKIQDLERVDAATWSRITATFSVENSRTILDSYRELAGFASKYDTPRFLPGKKELNN